MAEKTSYGPIELLAPARDRLTAVAAIDCGADAVYMGAPRFGARKAAGNTPDDIAAVADYAHMFGARLYVTLNTVLFEDELADAERMARMMVQAGADALIVQDMAYAEMGIEGVELHASTQVFNASTEKAAFLARSGFSRVILERSLSLDEIKAIRAATDVELECFVHGAICVCRSGRCYMSRVMSPRSGNRGDCSQACRMTYDLEDGSGQILQRGRHLLSVKDLDLSSRIGELLDAGITSFKIEGRLKDEAYVKNTVSWYRRRIDALLATRPHLTRASSGRSDVSFEPDISKTFTRGWTEYYFAGRTAGVSTPDTPKATGVLVGRSGRSGAGWFECDAAQRVSAGDGLCFMLGGELSGANVNVVEGRRIYISRHVTIPAGTEVYRNYDHRFATMLDGCRIRRALPVSATVEFGNGYMKAIFTDEDGNSGEASLECTGGAAHEPQRMLDTMATQLRRSGDTVFDVVEVSFLNDTGDGVPFVRISELNALRREGLRRLSEVRMARPPRRKPALRDRGVRYPYGDSVPPSENVTNSLARRFYEKAGCSHIEDGYDLRTDLRGVAVMTTPYCIRRETGMCPKNGGDGNGPLWLRHGTYLYRLEFDCAECVMRVIYESGGRGDAVRQRHETKY